MACSCLRYQSPVREQIAILMLLQGHSHRDPWKYDSLNQSLAVVKLPRPSLARGSLQILKSRCIEKGFRQKTSTDPVRFPPLYRIKRFPPPFPEETEEGPCRVTFKDFHQNVQSSSTRRDSFRIRPSHPPLSSLSDECNNSGTTSRHMGIAGFLLDTESRSC